MRLDNSFSFIIIAENSKIPRPKPRSDWLLSRAGIAFVSGARQKGHVVETGARCRPRRQH